MQTFLSKIRDLHSKSEYKLSKQSIDQKDNIKKNSNNKNLSGESNENEAEEEEDEQYPIERIIARRISKKTKKLEYFVKWVGYDFAESTWEGLQNLIEDNCFEKIYDYENLDLEQKIQYLEKYKPLSRKLKQIDSDIINRTETCKELLDFKENYREFNPLLKKFLDQWEYGNLNDDTIDYILPFHKSKKEGIILKCFWKKRENEDKPREPRFYPYKVVKNVDRENIYKSFMNWNK